MFNNILGNLVKEGGIISSLDPLSGEVLKANRTPEAMEEYFASPVAADGKVFLLRPALPRHLTPGRDERDADYGGSELDG